MTTDAELMGAIMRRLGLDPTTNMEMEKCKIKAVKLLVVEGNHERDFFTAWLEHSQLAGIQVLPIGGKTQLSDNLQILVRQPKFRDVTCLVIVRDADDNPAGAFQSVCGAMMATGIAPCPQQPWTWHTLPNPKNTVVQIKTCVLVLPDSTNCGALEELLMQTVTNDAMYNDATTLIQNAVTKLSQPGIPRKPPPAHRRGKAGAHAFLSTFEEPDKDQGKAAGSGVWNFDHAALGPLKQILLAM